VVAGATATQNSPFSSLAVAVTIASTHCAYPRRNGQAELAWVAGYSLPARRQSPIPLLTGLNVEQLRWSRPTRYRYSKPPSQDERSNVCFSNLLHQFSSRLWSVIRNCLGRKHYVVRLPKYRDMVVHCNGGQFSYVFPLCALIQKYLNTTSKNSAVTDKPRDAHASPHNVLPCRIWSFCLKEGWHTEEPQKLRSAGTPLSWGGRRGSPQDIRPSRTCVTTSDLVVLWQRVRA